MQSSDGKKQVSWSVDETSQNTERVGISIQESEPQLTAEESFHRELGQLVNELTHKVLIHQPDDVNLFLADYLEDKIRRERRKVGKFKKRNKHKRSRRKHASPSSAAAGGQAHGLQIPSQTIYAARVSPNVSDDEYGVADCTPKRTFPGSPDALVQCALFKDYVIASSEDTNTRIYDTNTGKLKLTIPNHKEVHCFVVVPIDDKKILLLLGSNDGQVPGWRIKFGAKCSAKFTVIIPMHQPNPIRAMVASPRGQYLASGCCFEMTQISLWSSLETAVRGTLKTWDLSSIIKYVDNPKRYFDDVEHLRLKTYKQIMSRAGAGDQRLVSSYARLSDTGKDESSYGIRSIAFTPDDARVVVGFGHPTQAEVKDMKLMALLDAKTLDTLWLQYAYFYQVINIMAMPQQLGSATPDVFQLMVATEYHLNRCNIETSDGDDVKRKKCRVKFPWRIEFKYGGHVGGCFSPDGELFATACGCTLVVFRAVDGRQIATYDGHTRVIRHVAYSSDGKHIVTCSDDKTVKVWNAPDKQVGAGLESPRSPALGHSPRRVSGISKPIPILSELYPVRSLSATGDDDAASPPRSPGVNRRLVRRSSLTELSPASYAKDEDGKVETDVYDQSLHHIHLRKIDDAVLKQ